MKSPLTVDALAPGPHNILIRAVDDKGNADPTPIDFSWNIESSPPPVLDRFGIAMLYPSVIGGRVWESKWDNGISRTFGNSSNDKYDPEFWTLKYTTRTAIGDGSYKCAGDGILKITGAATRMYIANPNLDWGNCELTLYGMNISADMTNYPYGGLEAVFRSNHGFLNDEDLQPCDDRGMAGSINYSGECKIQKEVCHHCDQIPGHDGYAQNSIQLYSGTLPKNIWIGMKVVIRDVIVQSTGQTVGVNMQVWRDQSDGLNGGNWQKVHEVTDDGTNFLWSDSRNNTGVLVDPCKSTIPPGLMFTTSNSRPGSETGRPNVAVYLRSDGVATDGLWYKKASIRTIDPILI